MKSRIRPLSNLYHRWGRRLGWDAETIARALEGQNMIERIGLNQYREIKPIPPVDPKVWDAAVIAAVCFYVRNSHGQP